MNDVKTEELNWKEKMASIDKQLAEHDRLRQQITLEPWKMLIAGFSSGVIVLMISITLLKVLGII